MDVDVSFRVGKLICEMFRYSRVKDLSLDLSPYSLFFRHFV